jgi:hypothetical protein
MKKHLVGLAVLALGMLSVARSASADQGGVTSDTLLGLGFIPLDLGLAVADLAAGARAEWPSRVYGGFEATVAGAQFAICLDRVLSTREPNSPGLWEIEAGFGAILMTHGLVTLLAPQSHTEAPAPPGPAMIAPLALSDVARASAPGLAVLGRF